MRYLTLALRCTLSLFVSMTATAIFLLIPTAVRIGAAPRSELDGPVVARVYFTDQADLNRLAGRLDVWEVDHNERYFVALLAPEQYAALVTAGYRVEIDAAKTALLELGIRSTSQQTEGIPGFACYRTVEETYSDMAQLAIDHPHLATWIDIGDSWDKTTPGGSSGYDIKVLVLTNKEITTPKPAFILMGALHARELPTAELAARFAEDLIARYGEDPDVTWLLDYHELHVIPIANPDGRKWAEGGELWRKNTNSTDGCHTRSPPSSYYGVDLNRNSSFKWNACVSGSCSSSNACAATYRGRAPASEPETQAIQTYVASVLADQRGPQDTDPAPVDATGLFITLHSYGELVLFPWGWSPTPAPNDAHLETLGRKFGYFTGYTVCQSGEPGCIYATDGTTDDWAYGELGIAAYTFELGAGPFFEPCETFTSSTVPDIMPALEYAFKAARRPYEAPAGPDTLTLSITPTVATPGTPVTLTAVADDTRYDSNGWGTEPTQAISAARLSIDAPPWLGTTTTYPLVAHDGTFDAATESVQTTIDTAGLAPGRHLLFVESQDAAGHWGVPSAIFLPIVEPLYFPLIVE